MRLRLLALMVCNSLQMVQYTSIMPQDTLPLGHHPPLVAILKNDISVTELSGEDRPCSVSQGMSQSRIRADLLL